jgi:hypothetical protein
MARRSTRKKAISPETILESDEEGFVAVASDDQYVVSRNFLIFLILSFIELTIFNILTKKASPTKTAAMAKRTPSLL